MSSGPESPDNGPPTLSGTEESGRFVGVVTRAVSWVLDAVAINVVAIVTGVGVELILSIFPISTSFASVLKPIAGVAYVVWAGAYFVVFWSWTGQTLGARVMRIQLLTAHGGRVKPARSVVRWVGMNLAMVPLFAGYAPILFGRRGFPDWLARTVVLEAQQMSLAEVRRARVRAATEDRPQRPPAISAGSEPGAFAFGDGDGPSLGMHENPGSAQRT